MNLREHLSVKLAPTSLFANFVQAYAICIQILKQLWNVYAKPDLGQTMQGNVATITRGHMKTFVTVPLAFVVVKNNTYFMSQRTRNQNKATSHNSSSIKNNWKFYKPHVHLIYCEVYLKFLKFFTLF